MEKILKVLNRIEELEGSLADLYSRLSRAFADNKEEHDFFASLSEEEESHRDLARYQIRLVRNSHEPFTDVDIDIACIESLISRAREFAQHTAPTMEDALQVTLELETNLAEHYISSAIKKANPEVSGLIDNLCRGGRKHLRDCIEMGKRYHVPLPDLADDLSQD